MFTESEGLRILIVTACLVVIAYDVYNYDTAVGLFSPQDPYNIRQYNYGDADYDARHYLEINYVRENFFRHIFTKGGPKDLVGDWTISRTLFTRTAQPSTVVDSAGGALAGSGYGLDAAIEGGLFATPAQPGYNNCYASAVNAETPCLQVSQFASGTGNLTKFGDQTRDQFRGPGYFDTDMSIMKDFKIPRWEEAKLGVGFQFFNLLNHPTFDNPVNDIAQGVGAFGTINNLVSPPTSILGSFVGSDASGRIIQLKAPFVLRSDANTFVISHSE